MKLFLFQVCTLFISSLNFHLRTYVCVSTYKRRTYSTMFSVYSPNHNSNLNIAFTKFISSKEIWERKNLHLVNENKQSRRHWRSESPKVFPFLSPTYRPNRWSSKNDLCSPPLAFTPIYSIEIRMIKFCVDCC